MLAHAYIRYSTAEQAKGGSLARQRRAISEHIAEQGWTTGGEYFDSGKSASKGTHLEEGAELHRFEQEALAGLHDGSALVVERIDRLSRLDHEATYGLIKRLNDAGVTIAVVANGKLYRANQSIPLVEIITLLVEADAAKQETSKLGDRVAKGKAIKRAKRQAEGTSTRHMLPPWCSLDADGRAVVIEDRAAMVLGWFEATRDGVPTGQIVRGLEASGVKPWGRSKIWHRTYISKTLANRTVLGEFQPVRMVGGRKEPLGEPWAGHFPEIVPHDLFELVNRSAADRKRAWGGRRSVRLTNLFAGLVECRACGGAMHFKCEAVEGSQVRCSDNKKLYTVRRDRGQFICSTARVSGGRKCTNRAAWSYIIFEDAVVRALLPLAMDDRAFSDRSAVVELRGLIAQRERQLEITSGRAVRLWEEWATNDSQSLKDAANRADGERQQLESELTELRAKFDAATGRVTVAEHLARVDDIAKALYEPDMDRRLITRRKVMVAFNGLISRICLGADQGTISLHDGIGTAKDGVGLLLIDRSGEITGWNLVKRGDETTPYKKRLAKAVAGGTSPFG